MYVYISFDLRQHFKRKSDEIMCVQIVNAGISYVNVIGIPLSHYSAANRKPIWLVFVEFQPVTYQSAFPEINISFLCSQNAHCVIAVKVNQ